MYHLLPIGKDWALNLKTLQIEPGTFTGWVGVKYDPCARNELWDNFMSKFTNDSEQLQIEIGCAITGRLEQPLILVGEGSNGKTTFARAIEYVLAGPSNIWEYLPIGSMITTGTCLLKDYWDSWDVNKIMTHRVLYLNDIDDATLEWIASHNSLCYKDWTGVHKITFKGAVIETNRRTGGKEIVCPSHFDDPEFLDTLLESPMGQEAILNWIVQGAYKSFS